MGLFSSLAALAGDSGVWEGISDSDGQRIRDGEIVSMADPTGEVQGRRIQVAFLINQPIERAWELFLQPERQDEFTTRLVSSVIVAERPTGKIVHFKVKILFFTIQYRVSHFFDSGAHRIDTRLDPTYENDLKTLDGTWRLYAVDESTTLAHYSSLLRVSSFIPSFVGRYLNQKDIPTLMQAWRRWIESGGTWRKDE